MRYSVDRGERRTSAYMDGMNKTGGTAPTEGRGCVYIGSIIIPFLSLSLPIRPHIVPKTLYPEQNKACRHTPQKREACWFTDPLYTKKSFRKPNRIVCSNSFGVSLPLFPKFGTCMPFSLKSVFKIALTLFFRFIAFYILNTY